VQGRDDRSIGELFTELTQETSTLVRQEIQLAKAEMSQKASRVGKDIGFLAAGGAVAYAGFLAILAGIIALLGLVIPVWVSALLVGIVVAVIGYFLVRKGLDALKQEDPAPQETMESLKEDRQWMRDQRR
jgi:Flp pilus assembly protein TadB